MRMIVESTVRLRLTKGDWIARRDSLTEWFEFELSLDKARELRRLLTRELRHAAKTNDEGKETT